MYVPAVTCYTRPLVRCSRSSRCDARAGALCHGNRRSWDRSLARLFVRAWEAKRTALRRGVMARKMEKKVLDWLFS